MLTSVGNYRKRADFFAYEYDDTCDLTFLSSFVDSRTNAILDIPCGTGRVTLPLSNLGRPIVAVDRESQMIGVLRERLSVLSPRPLVRPVVGTFTSVSLGQWFDLILVPREAFQLLLSEEDALSALKNLRKHLTSSGRMIVDLANFSGKRFRNANELPDYFTPALQDRVEVLDWTKKVGFSTIERRRWQDNSNERLFWIACKYRVVESPVERTFNTKIGFVKYTDQGFRSLSDKAGLEVITTYGGYDGGRVGEEEARLVFVLKSADVI